MTTLDRLRAEMAKKAIPALLVADIESAQWLTGFTGSSAKVLLTESGGRFVTDSRYDVQAKEQVKGLDIAIFKSGVEADAFLADQVSGMGVQRLAVDGSKVTYQQFEKLAKALGSVELYAAEDPIADLRLIKTPEEIEKIRAACKLADACMEHVLRLIQPGVTEWEINLEVEFFFRRNRADLAFDPIVVSGANSARPQGRATEKPLEKGDFVTLDFGAKLDGWCSDITRTFVVGAASDRHREIYGQVLAAQIAAIEAMRPGMIAKDIDKISREKLAEKGLDGYFGHGLGHGLGRLVHDGGGLGPRSETVLASGQVWTVEPGVYIEGFGGVRIEDDVVVTDSGVEILTHFTKDLLELPR